MKALTSLPLDDDIIDRIFTFLPDFATLQAAVLASKSCYGIYKSHPNSITRAVLYNQLGPALPQAIRVLRFQIPGDFTTVTPGVNAWEESDIISPISSSECQELVANARDVHKLEDLFSLRHKDRTSRKSTLSFVESWRFRRGVYRIMLFSKIFSVSFDGDDLDDDEVATTRLQRKRFLAEFHTDELRELYSIVQFLTEIVQWSADACEESDAHHLDDIWVSLGPQIALQSYELASTSVLYEHMSGFDLDEADEFPPTLENFISDPLSQIWAGRNVKPPADDQSHWKSILDEVKGENDLCHNCAGAGTLWSQAGWPELKGCKATTMNQFVNFLQGNLKYNLIETEFLKKYTIHSPNFQYSAMITKMFELKVTGFESWTPQDSFCENCMANFIRSHIHLWLLERKRIAAEPILEDCWYGYDCRTQTHRLPHATRLNHLCEPSRTRS
ncbi:hypothetical protein BD779DRAFT_1485777 [Infundibulicybe gibba]|nr:hypothetical protein BD779DRAFT_1485777 [Infundibulicybe gibba]